MKKYIFSIIALYFIMISFSGVVLFSCEEHFSSADGEYYSLASMDGVEVAAFLIYKYTLHFGLHEKDQGA